jgi:uncharacterized protein (DUF697 family)
MRQFTACLKTQATAEELIDMTEIVTDKLAVSETLPAAQQVVARFAKYAAIGGLVPIPVLDMAAVAGVQLKMMEQLAAVYGLPFKENLAKELIGTIVGTGVTYNFGNAALMAFNQYIRFVPVAGQLFGLAIMPAFAAASTAALGQLFVRHFESGGKLMDVNLTEARKAFKADFGRRQKTANVDVVDLDSGTVVPA